MKPPTVSVVLSSYNAAAFLAESINSILNQTFTDFELIVIDDGSTDETPKLLRKLHDKRLKIISQTNAGLVVSLNRGITLAQGQLIARQDADDRSDPQRLERLVSAFHDDPKLVLCGSSMQVMNMQGTVMHSHFVLLEDLELKQELLVRSPFAHGSVMFRKAAWKRAGGYRQKEWPAEDYGLWLRLAPLGKFANLDEPLYIYRENEHGISHSNVSKQAAKALIVRNHAWASRELFLSRLSPNINRYRQLQMGQFRISRITRNYLFGLRQSIIHCSPAYFIGFSRILFHNRDLRRKCARLILVTLGLKSET